MKLIKKKYLLYFVLVIGLILLPAILYSESPSTDQKEFQADRSKATVVHFKDMAITVKPGTAPEKMSVRMGKAADYAKLRKPRLFQAISAPYEFGPDGLAFTEDTMIHVSIKVTPGMVPQGHSPNEVKLFYINKKEGQLEPVVLQFYDEKTGTLEADLIHFSSYVPGIMPGWDGEGIAPYTDFINSGEETVSVCGLNVSANVPIYSLPGRGMDTYFGMRFTENNQGSPFSISRNWVWDMLYYKDGSLNIPGGGAYDIPTARWGNGVVFYTFGDVSLEAYYDGGGFLTTAKLMAIYMKDGAKLIIDRFMNPFNLNSYHFYGTKVYDSKGNSISYGYSFLPSILKWRVTSVTDTVGRSFSIDYNSSGDFNSLKQNLNAGGQRTIYSRSGNGSDSDTFTDVLGRIKTYHYGYGIYNSGFKIYRIDYPNGNYTIFDYTWDNVIYNTTSGGYRVSQQRFYKPGPTGAVLARTITYDQTLSSDPPIPSPGCTATPPSSSTTPTPTPTPGENIVSVNDGIKLTKYYLNEGQGFGLIHIGPQGYTYKEQTYDIVGGSPTHLMKEVTTTYLAVGANNNYGLPVTVTTKLAKSDYTLGVGATYSYGYDGWGNQNYIKDPYGTITRMVYSQTSSTPNLSAYNSTDNIPYPDTYYNYIYTFPDIDVHDRLLTKATYIRDSVNTNNNLMTQTHYKYDNEANMIEESILKTGTPSYLVTSYTYDTYGNKLSQIDPEGHELDFEYSVVYHNAYLTRVENPDGNDDGVKNDSIAVAEYIYDFDLGKLLVVKDPKAMQNLTHHIDYEYDFLGRRIQETLDDDSDDPDVEVSKIITYHDAIGDATDDNIVDIKYGNVTSGWQYGRITFDWLCAKPIKIERKLDGIWKTQKTNTYDKRGRLETNEDNLTHTTQFQYDALDRQTRITYEDNTYTQFSWDQRDLTTTDAKGNVKKEYHDLLDRLTEARNYYNVSSYYTTQYTYDSAGKLLKTKNVNQSTEIKNKYNGLGQLIQVNYPDSTQETFTYYDGGQMHEKTGPVGSSTGTKHFDYEYFAGYRVKTVTEPSGTGSHTINYTYDRNDNPLTMSVSGVASYTYGDYDERNRPHSYSAQLDSTTFNMSCDYDTFGHTTSVTYPGWTTPVTYDFDDLDRLLEVGGTIGGSAYDFVSDCDYDGDNKLTAVVYGNGITNSYAYNTMDRLTGISAGTNGSVLDLDYTFDNIGNITQINDEYYGYDGLNQLIWAGDQTAKTVSNCNGTVWNYDGAGNMSQKQLYHDGAAGNNTNFTNTNSNNRLTAMGNWSFTYNNAGACTQKSRTGLTWDYSYDTEARLTEVKRNSTSVETYAYDGNGMRYKTVKGGATTYYIYNGGANPIAEYTPADGVYKYFINAGDKAIGEVVKNGTSTTVKYYHKDHLGSTCAITNSSGNVLSKNNYEPFGANKPVINETFNDNNTTGWTVTQDHASFTAQNQSLTILHSTTAYGGDYLKQDFDSQANVVFEFDAKIGSLNNNCASLDVESNGFNLVYFTNKIYYRKDGSDTWHQVADNLRYGQWHHFKLVLTSGRIEIYVDDVLKYTTSGSFAAKDYIAFRDYGMCVGAVTNYVDNITVAAHFGDYDYTGKKISQDTGLVYFGGRWYDPEIGRFITQDPAKDGANWYAYCMNDPVNKVDNNGKYTSYAHTALTNAVAKTFGLSMQDRNKMSAANRAMDNKTTTYYSEPDHYGNAENAAWERMSNALSASDKNTALTELGRGLHSVEDNISHALDKHSNTQIDNPYDNFDAFYEAYQNSVGYYLAYELGIGNTDAESEMDVLSEDELREEWDNYYESLELSEEDETYYEAGKDYGQ